MIFPFIWINMNQRTIFRTCYCNEFPWSRSDLMQFYLKIASVTFLEIEKFKQYRCLMISLFLKYHLNHDAVDFLRRALWRGNISMILTKYLCHKSITTGGKSHILCKFLWPPQRCLFTRALCQFYSCVDFKHMMNKRHL